MKQLILLIIYLLTFLNLSAQVNDSIVDWFKDSKLGMFIHWGLYSHTAGDWKGRPSKGAEHFMLYERIPLKEYSKIANEFDPVDFNASDWVKKAKYAGMKYMIVTAKHHDGFAMYDSKVSDYNIVKRTPFARDPMSEIIKACREEGLKFGFYYSLGRDWENPNVPTNWPVKGGRSNTWDYPDEDNKRLEIYIEEKVKPQITELLTNYGEIDFIWFDTPELVTKEQSLELRKLIFKIQPNCMVNQRIGNNYGDYEIVEQKLNNDIRKEPWEACLTMGKNWSFNKYDTIYKKPDILIRHFVDIVSKGGNLLLNIGPDGKGCFPVQTEPGLAEFHNWLGKYGEAIYGTQPWRVYGENLMQQVESERINENFHDAEYDGTPQEIVPDFRYTNKDNIVYIIVRHVEDKEYVLSSFTSDDRIKSIESIDSNMSVKWKIIEEKLKISVFGKKKDLIYVLKVNLLD